MDKIVENYPDYQVFMILIDNTTYHRGDIVREHIYKLRGQGKNIKLIRFPRYCSDLNPIEEEWRPFKRGLHNQIILIKEELTSAVVDGIAAISAASKGLLSKYFPILFG